MQVRIAAVGMATSQGGVNDILTDPGLLAPGELPWYGDRWTTCHQAYSAVGVESSVMGDARWNELAQRALDDCYQGEEPSAGTLLLLASCNGAAPSFDREYWRRSFNSTALIEGTVWSGRSLPVFSSSCNSGLHALHAARRLLLSGCAREIVVLAVDILSAANHDNFEVLRVLSPRPAPWQVAAAGFIPGEAGVALRLVTTHEDAPILGDVAVGSDLVDHDGLQGVLKLLDPADVELLVGQGTGPYRSDELELAALDARLPASVPLTTPLTNFGHTLGASSLLSIALATLAWRREAPIESLRMHNSLTFSGRPLFRNTKRPGNVLVSCRAMSGSCAAVTIGTPTGSNVRVIPGWSKALGRLVLMHPVLRKVTDEAIRHRPVSAPDLLVVKMDAPLIPDERAMLGGRLLPSAVLELTPGFVSQLVARSWSFPGGAICLVGGTDTDPVADTIAWGCQESGLKLSRMWLRGDGDDRTIEWEI